MLQSRFQTLSRIATVTSSFFLVRVCVPMIWNWSQCGVCRFEPLRSKRSSLFFSRSCFSDTAELETVWVRTFGESHTKIGPTKYRLELLSQIARAVSFGCFVRVCLQMFWISSASSILCYKWQQPRLFFPSSSRLSLDVADLEACVVACRPKVKLPPQIAAEMTSICFSVCLSV